LFYVTSEDLHSVSVSAKIPHFTQFTPCNPFIAHLLTPPPLPKRSSARNAVATIAAAAVSLRRAISAPGRPPPPPLPPPLPNPLSPRRHLLPPLSLFPPPAALLSNPVALSHLIMKKPTDSIHWIPPPCGPKRMIWIRLGCRGVLFGTY